MSVCRRINYFPPPKVVTITVYIYSEPNAIPRFGTVELYNEQQQTRPQKLAAERKNGDVPKVKKLKSKNGLITKKKKKTGIKDAEPKINHFEEDTPPISEVEELIDVSFIIDKLENAKNNELRVEWTNNHREFYSDVAIIKIKNAKLPRSIEKKKVRKTPPRYQVIEFKESTINIFVEMEKQNIGEFVWDQQCTRIDALVVPIPELDRTTTPEIPICVEILP